MEEARGSARRRRGDPRESQAAPRIEATSGALRVVRFVATVHTRAGRSILVLPDVASKKLPSRGQVAVHGTINGVAFRAVLEPDGEFGHWMNVDPKLRETAGIGPGDGATVEVSPADEWPEPSVPPDFRAALSTAPREVRELWQVITPMARWEWVRWVNETKSTATRKKRVAVSISKLNSGKRRPCCFNLASCTDPELSRSGKLVRD